MEGLLLQHSTIILVKELYPFTSFLNLTAMKRYLFFTLLFILVLGALGMKFYRTDEKAMPQSSVVDLSNQNLKEIPDEYKEQILKAEVLILDGNDISYLPIWLKEAVNLKKISLNNNSDFDFFQFCVDFQEMKQIEEISASNCFILNIPYQLTFFERLKKLDLSHNQIKNIPYHLGFMTSLLELDLSNNRISEMGYSLRELYQLKSLDLSSNPQMNLKEFCESLEHHNFEFLKLDLRDTLPENFSTISVLNSDFTLFPEVNLNHQLTQLKTKSLVLRSHLNGNLPVEWISQIGANKNLEHLSLINFQMPEVPQELTRLQNLKSLDLSGSGLQSIENLKDMVYLNSLSVKENELSLEKIQELKNSLSACIIESDEEKLMGKGISYEILAPISDYHNPIDKKVVDPSRKNVFVSSTKNTVFEIPANAFVDEKGKIITDPVEISLVEYNDPVELALSGIPMQIKKEDGSTGDFSSAGMFQFIATSKGKEVFPNPKALITANIYSKQSTPYNLYTFKEKKGWTLAQSEPVQPVSPTTISPDNSTVVNSMLTTNAFDYSLYEELLNLKIKMADTIVVDRGVIYEPKVIMNHKKSASTKSFTISFDYVPMFHNTIRQGKNWKYTCPKETDEVMNQKLIYNDYNYEADVALLDSVKRIVKKTYNTKKETRKRNRKRDKLEYEYNENVILKDISITPDPKKDDYILKFSFKGRSHEFHVVLPETSSNTEKIQKQNQKYYQNYLFSTRLMKETQKKELDKYTAYYDRKEKQLRKDSQKFKKEYEKKMRAYEEKVKETGMTLEDYQTMKDRSEGMVYSFQLASFGITNCDVVSRMQKPGRVKAKFKDVMGKTLLFLKMIRIDKKMNVISTLGREEALDIDYAHDQTGIVFIIDEEHIGIVDSKTLFQYRDDRSIPVKIMKSDELKPEKIRSLI